MSGKKKLLITGSTGYIGSELVKKLICSNEMEIAVVVRNLSFAKQLFQEDVNYIVYDHGEIFNDEVKSFAPNIVIHLASYSSSSDTTKDIEKLIESNIIFTTKLLVALSGSNVELFINSGSFSEYDKSREEISPTYFYSATKTSVRYMIEYFSKRDNFTFVNAILYSVYGKESNPKKIIDYALASFESIEGIDMSEGNQKLDFVHIDDVVDAYMYLINNYKNLNFLYIDYDIGTAVSTSIRELVQLLESLTRKKANINWGAYKNRRMDTKVACANPKYSIETLGYKIKYDLNRGLQKYLARENL